MVRRYQRGVTLLEMMMVVTIIAIMVAVTFPAITSGVDSLRLRAASGAIVSLMNAALDRADRRQVAVEVSIHRDSNTIQIASAEPGYVRETQLPEGVTIERVMPEIPGGDPRAPRSFLLLPGGVVPRIGIDLVNRRGARRTVSVDPITNVAIIAEPR